MSNIKLFEDKEVRTFWDEKEEQWYFSIVDVVEVLTNSANPRDYWFKMKQRVKIEDGLETCNATHKRTQIASIPPPQPTHITKPKEKSKECDPPALSLHKIYYPTIF